MSTCHVEGDDLEIKHEQPRAKVPVEEVILRPELSLDEAKDRWLNKSFDRTHRFKYHPEVSTFYRTENGEAKLLFLRNVLDPDIYKKAYDQVRDDKIYTPASNSKRTALKDSPGGDCLFGFNDQLKPDQSGRRQQYPEWTAPSVKFFPRFRGLWPLCWEMEDLLGMYVPGYWEGREIDQIHGPAARGEDERNTFFSHHKQHMESVAYWADDWWRFWYSIPGSNFTTITVNWNTVFRAHKDANNSSGALSCLAAFGSYRHGELVFPRLDVAFSVKERDLLVCDCPRELHATIPPLGTRFSLVAYTREGLTRAGISNRTKKTPTVWDCHKGKNYPADAVYVGCRVLNRKGKLIREGHIFGNGTNPLVSHRGAIHSENAFRAYAIAKLTDDPAFRAEAEKLRARDLLCWCVQKGKRRAKFCHARVWLELINSPQETWHSEESLPEQRREFDWGFYEPNFLPKEEADALFEMAQAQPRERPTIPRSRYEQRRCASTTWSVRDQFAESVPLMVQLKDAPAEIVSLQRKLTDLAGKEVNYFSLQAYEDERDHIGWHQHREDKCRDARVFIISLGERRSFGVDKLCPECLLCDNCNRRRCRLGAPRCSTRAKCQAAKKHRTTCKIRKSTKTILLPKHGSLIALTSEANDWYEHAVLDDKEPKGLRISINTKCIPPEDAADGYVPRELRLAAHQNNRQSSKFT
jgi:alkylated DNA repair dioxygenase AlkB